MFLNGRVIYPGIVEGEALATRMGISFFGGVDPDSGVVVERGHELEGQSIAGKVLVFPTGKGSTVGSYTLYRLKMNGVAPLAILNAECETITAVGCIIAEIPCLDQIQIEALDSGQRLRVDALAGKVEILTSRAPSFDRLCPPPDLPDWLRGIEAGSFVEDTMSRRLPGIARRVLEEGDLSRDARIRLEALIADMPHGLIRLIRDPQAPDERLWEQEATPYLGQSWLEVPWLFGETYFFRRVLEACGYFQSGPGNGVDPYRLQKAAALEGVDALLASALHSLGPHPLSSTDLPEPDLASVLAGLLRRVIWGNQADLSLWPADSDGPKAPQADRLEAHLLVNDAQSAAAHILESEQPARIDFVLDNSGLELAFDLLVADFLLSRGLANEIVFHVKPYPTYVSDVIAADVALMLAHLRRAQEARIRSLAERLTARLDAVEDGRAGLRLTTHYHWVLPRPNWEMPLDLYAELAGSSLVISKGDANYRRWLGDRHWPFTTPFARIVAYRPAPLLALRVVKAEQIAGLPEGRQEQLDRLDSDWLYNGHWGMIQFIGRPAE